MNRFIRTGFTWQSYLLLAYFAYLQASLGLIMPFLRKELDLSYTISGLHPSAFALGMILAGLGSDRLIERWPYRPVMWLGGLGMAGGGVILLLGQNAFMTILGAGLMGLLGGILLIAIQANLSKKHELHKATALAEANILASIGAGLVPLAVGNLEKWGTNWRVAILVAIFVFIIIMTSFPRESFTVSTVVTSRSEMTRRLPAVFWLYWGVIFLLVAIEACLIFWGATYLEVVASLSKADASLAMSIFFGAVILGRIAGSRLTQRFSSPILLLTAMSLVLLGFPLFWSAFNPALSFVGLFIVGLGVANFYPLALAAAIETVPTLADVASARTIIGSGSAILLMPQLFGIVADMVTLKNAFSLILILLLAGLVLTLYARKRAVSQVMALS